MVTHQIQEILSPNEASATDAVRPDGTLPVSGLLDPL